MAISANTPVLTTNLWLQAKDLRPGDYVYGLDGKPKKIYLVQDINPTKTYKVVLDDGIVIRGDKNLTLPLEDKKYRINLCEFNNRKDRTMNTKRRAQLRRKTITEMLEAGLYSEGNTKKFSIPTAEPIQYPIRPLAVPPFVAGVWFGKMRRTDTIWVRKEQLKTFERQMRLNRFTIHKIRANGPKTRFEVRPHIGLFFLTDPRHVSIPTKVPEEYIMAAPEQRIEFLKGFFEYRDNCYNAANDYIEFKTKDIHFLRRIQSMVESLGIKTRTSFNKVSKVHFLYFKTDLQLNPKQKPKPRAIGYKRRFIVDIEEAEAMPCVHIEAEAPFIIGTEGFIGIC